MPILLNFHILLATFYTIFETNIMVQCLVPDPVCCLFYDLQKNNRKWPKILVSQIHKTKGLIIKDIDTVIRLRCIYNFWLFHANILQLSYILASFYTIFGTNILIQCPVPVHVCCMFYVSQKTNIKRNPNRINGRRIILEYLWFLGSKINARRCPRGAGDRGRAPGRQARHGLSWAPRQAGDALLLPQEK